MNEYIQLPKLGDMEVSVVTVADYRWKYCFLLGTKDSSRCTEEMKTNVANLYAERRASFNVIVELSNLHGEIFVLKNSAQDKSVCVYLMNEIKYFVSNVYFRFIRPILVKCDTSRKKRAPAKKSENQLC